MQCPSCWRTRTIASLWVAGNVRFAHGTRYATDYVRRLWLTPTRAVSIMSVCVCRVANVTDLIPSCDDRTSHGRRSRGLVSNPSLACLGSSIKREVSPRAPSLSLIIYAMLSDVNPHYLYLYRAPSSAGSSGRQTSCRFRRGARLWV